MTITSVIPTNAGVLLNIPSLDEGDVSGVNNALALRSAVARGGEVSLPAGTFRIARTILEPPLGEYGTRFFSGVKIKGRGSNATRFVYVGSTSTPAITIVPPFIQGGTAQQNGLWLEGFSLDSPGDNTGSGLLVGTNDNRLRITHVMTMHDVNFNEWDTCFTMDVMTNLYMESCRMRSFNFGLFFGFNCDIIKAVNCAFGDDAGAQGGQVLRFGFDAGHGLGVNGGNNYSFDNCWFLNLNAVAVVPTTGMIRNLVFNGSYFELCRSYLHASSGVESVTYNDCEFSRTFDATETSSKFTIYGSTVSRLNLVRNNASGTSGDAGPPNWGWVDLGAPSAESFYTNVHWEANRMEATGQGSTQCHVKGDDGGGTVRLIVLPDQGSGTYDFKHILPTAGSYERIAIYNLNTLRLSNIYTNTSDTGGDTFFINMTNNVTINAPLGWLNPNTVLYGRKKKLMLKENAVASSTPHSTTINSIYKFNAPFVQSSTNDANKVTCVEFMFNGSTWAQISAPNTWQ